MLGAHENLSRATVYVCVYDDVVDIKQQHKFRKKNTGLMGIFMVIVLQHFPGMCRLFDKFQT